MQTFFLVRTFLSMKILQNISYQLIATFNLHLNYRLDKYDYACTKIVLQVEDKQELKQVQL